MLIVFIGGDDAIRRFCTLRRHCPLYEERRGTWVLKPSLKETFLSLPPRSFVLLENDLDPEDGMEITCAEMRTIVQKSHRMRVLTRYASSRDLEIAAAILR